MGLQTCRQGPKTPVLATDPLGHRLGKHRGNRAAISPDFPRQNNPHSVIPIGWGISGIAWIGKNTGLTTRAGCLPTLPLSGSQRKNTTVSPADIGPDYRQKPPPNNHAVGGVERAQQALPSGQARERGMVPHRFRAGWDSNEFRGPSAVDDSNAEGVRETIPSAGRPRRATMPNKTRRGHRLPHELRNGPTPPREMAYWDSDWP